MVSNAVTDHIIKLNVGGENFSTLQSTLTSIPDSYFTRLLSGEATCYTDETGAIFLDRDPVLFRKILQFLRTHSISSFTGIDKKLIRDEVEFYGITPLLEYLNDQARKRAYPSSASGSSGLETMSSLLTGLDGELDQVVAKNVEHAKSVVKNMKSEVSNAFQQHKEVPKFRRLKGRPKKKPKSDIPKMEPLEFVCDWEKCHRTFDVLKNLVKHVEEHHVETQTSSNGFYCRWEKCERVNAFAAPYLLSMHLRKHTGERPFKCEVTDCDQTFARKENMRAHMRRHLEDRTFQCRQCEKSFRCVSDKLNHEKSVHSNEKPYVCLECPKKSYKDATALRKHYSEKHGPESWKEYRKRANATPKEYVLKSRTIENELKLQENEPTTLSSVESRSFSP
uniref:Uncharacterized protein n=1 Tax=Acrobeloides nanus TaxID=290746 RepID=A0A914E615_9BILA